MMQAISENDACQTIWRLINARTAIISQNTDLESQKGIGNALRSATGIEESIENRTVSVDDSTVNTEKGFAFDTGAATRQTAVFWFHRGLERRVFLDTVLVLMQAGFARQEDRRGNEVEQDCDQRRQKHGDRTIMTR